MAKKRDGDPWMPADRFGRELTGVGINLMVPDIERALDFQSQVLGAGVIYADPDFAAVRACGGTWLLHADHAYADHPMHGIAVNAEGRGAGIEIRLYGADPDDAEARARDRGYTILEPSADKPHGLRECFLVDDDGYVWVPSRPLTAATAPPPAASPDRPLISNNQLRGRLAVRRSPIHGRGLFARVDLDAEVYLGTYHGPRVRRNDMHVLWVEDRPGKWVGCDGKNMLRYLNHSENPNCEFDGLDLFTLRAVAAGEELTFDYGEDPG